MCAQCVDQWVAAGQLLRPAMEILRRRRELRYPSVYDFIIKPVTAGAFREGVFTGYNISAGGLGVLSRHPVPSGQDVLLQCEQDNAPDGEPSEAHHMWLTAQVIHCTQTVGGYKIGLRFEQ